MGPIRARNSPRGSSLVLAVVALIVSGEQSLRDHPIATSEPLEYLDGSDWTVSTLAGAVWSNHTQLKVPATVPGDLATDLQRAGVISDPYFNNSFIAYAEQWASPSSAWRYEKQFQALDRGGATPTTSLVFDGVKMAASVTLNGRHVGFTTSQFLRYRFDVTDALVPGTNVLHVDFEGASGTLSPALPDDGGRFMACTGGWDWAPLSPTRNSRGTPTFSKGIWKAVYLSRVPPGGVAIHHLSPQVFYNGPYPTARLPDAGSSRDYNFSVVARVEVWSPAALANATLQLEGSWDDGVVRQVRALHIPARRATVLNVTLPALRPALWWPLGLGPQRLYTLTARAYGSGQSQPSESTRTVGFRSVALVTVNDTDPLVVAAASGQQGSGNFSMFFRVNGVPLFSRGANFVPMEEFEGRASVAATVRLVKSAAEAGFNMLRIWAGGVYQYSAFYEACDALGVLLYHDMMFIEQGHGPCCPYYACASGWSCAGHPYNASCDCDTPAGDHQRAEIVHQVRRLAHHASVVVYDGCNECSGSGRYADFVMATVAAEDASRPVWPASPSPGWLAGVHRLTGLPVPSAALVPSHGRFANRSGANCSAPCTACQCSLCGCNEVESHGPYVGDTPAFYAGLEMAPDFSAATFGKMGHFADQLVAGPSQRGHFTSEFGCTGLSSWESMSASLPPSEWSVGSSAMKRRNHPPASQIERYFGVGHNLTATGRAPFQRQLYQHMMAQAWWLKVMLEQTRRTNEWGMLFWMFNESSDCLLRVETASDSPWAATANEMLFAFPHRLVLPQVRVVADVAAADTGASGATVSLSTTGAGGGKGGMALAVVLTTASAGRFTRNVISLMPGTVTVTAFVPWEEGGEFNIGEFQRTLRVEHLQEAV
eukprot:g2784.t1